MTTVFQLFKDLLMLKTFPELGHNAGYGLLFLLGVLTSFHCIAMCGGIAISQTLGRNRNDAGKESGRHAWLLPSVLYNSGRVLSYTLVGGIVGGLGQVVGFTGVWKGVIPVIGGLFMVIMGINLLGIFAPLRRLNIRMPYFAARKIKEKNNNGPFYIGLLNGLMPCGPLQIVQLYALGTQSVFFGALSMLIFSLGTVPLLFAIGAVHSVVNKKYANRILKLSAVFVIFLGIVMMERGLSLASINVPMPGSSIRASSGASIAAHVEGHVQKVTTSIKSDSYPPITVQKGIPVQWTIHADEENLNECNNEISIPKFKIEKKLLEGDNLVEFTPEETGEFVFTCWMGMIKSKITVVEKAGDTASIDSSKAVLEKPAEQAGAAVPQNEPSAEPLNQPLPKKEELKTPEPQPVKAIGSPSPEPTAAPSQTEKTVLAGYLIDRHCFGQVSPGKETRTCLTMEDCEASGYGIAVKQEDGQYKFFLFDANGHQLAKDFLSRSNRNTDFSIRVTGQPKGEFFQVTALTANDDKG